MTLPVTTALAYTEPARTQANEWLIEERVRSALQAVVPKGDKRKEVGCITGRDRRGHKRVRNIPVGATIELSAQEAFQILNKYGRGRPITIIDSSGRGLRANAQTYIREVELDENAGRVMALNGNGTFNAPDSNYGQDDDDKYEEVDLSDSDDDDDSGERAAAVFAAALEAAGTGEEADEAVVDEPAASDADVDEPAEAEPAPAAPSLARGNRNTNRR